MFTLASQPQGIGRNLDNGFRLMFAGLGAAAILLFILIVLDVILFAVFGAGVLGMLAQLETGQLPQGGYGMFAVFIIIFYIINLMFNNAITAKYGSVAYSQDMSIGQAIGVGAKKILPVFVFAILYALILLVASIPLFILISIFPPQDIVGALALIIGLIPPMIFGLTLIFGTYLIIIDDAGIFEAISRSHKLVWGNWWRTFLYLTILIIILIAVMFTIQLTFGLIIGFVASSAPGEGNMTFMIIMQVLNQIISLVFIPVMVALLIPYFHDLKLRKEGSDLVARVSAA